MSKAVEKMSKEELIQEVYRLADWSGRLESALKKIRDMTEKAGRNEHARYCFEIANELITRKGIGNGNQEEGDSPPFSGRTDGSVGEAEERQVGS